MRRRPALLSALTATALIAVALAGCAPAGRGPGNQPAGCTPALPSGDASSIVKASGALGESPTTTFPTPLIGSSSQVTVLEAGHGTPAAKGAQVDVQATVYDARTGRSLAATSYDRAQPFRVAAGVSIPTQSGAARSTIAEALTCAQTGSRIALTATGPSLGLGIDTKHVVVVIDVASAYLGKADGANQLPKDGMPTVVTAVDGQPGIVLQELRKPTAARSEVVKAGGGAVLKKGQDAVLMFTAWTWPTGGEKPAVVDSLDTWAGRQAATVALDPSSGLPAAALTALIGQKVGSQVLVVLPPAAGFGATAPSGITADDTVVLVFDLLGVQR